MRSVPVIASVTKLFMARPWIQGKVERGSAHPGSGGGRIPPLFFEKLLKFSNFSNLSFMHLVHARTNVTKLSMALS
jgi:hypothetical protein